MRPPIQVRAVRIAPAIVLILTEHLSAQ